MSGCDDKTKGKFEDLKSSVKKHIGNATGDDNLSRGGRADHARGNGRRAFGNVKDALGDAKDAVKDSVRKKD